MGAVILTVVASGCAFVTRANDSSTPTTASPSTASAFSFGVSVSGDGRFVAFSSAAPDLVAGDTNANADVFVRDRQTGTYEVVSLAVGGGFSNGASGTPAISSDGRYVSFGSSASNLVAGDANGFSDVFVRDLQTDTTVVASVTTGGVQGNGGSFAARISANGRFVGFESGATNLVPADTNAVSDIFVRDLIAGTTERVDVSSAGAQANASAFAPASLSGDGRFVAFASSATNLVADDTNAVADVFVRDRQTSTTTRISVATGGAQATGNSGGAAFSNDGSVVAFSSDATNLVAGDTNAATDVFVRNLGAGTTERVSLGSGGAQANGASSLPSISADGRYVAFQSVGTNLAAGDANGATDIYRRDRTSGTAIRISLSSSGAEPNGNSTVASISADGAFVGFSSLATNLASFDANANSDAFVRNVGASSTELISRYMNVQSNDAAGGPSLSEDGRYVAFWSVASNLVPNDTNAKYDVFRRDLVSGVTQRVSLTSTGGQGNDISGSATISGDGRYVVFSSYASNLVPGDTNGLADIFVRDISLGTTELITVAMGGGPNNGVGAEETITADGRYVAFVSDGTNLVAGDTNNALDVFVRDRQTATTTRVSVSTAGVQGDSRSASPDISDDGRFVSFLTSASNLVPPDMSNGDDIVVRDRQTSTTFYASLNSAGVQANSLSGFFGGTSISGNGRYVAFDSFGSNLVAGDTNGTWDLFVRDLQTNTTERVSVSSAGVQANGISRDPRLSRDGRYVAFDSDASNLVAGDTNANTDVFVRDRTTNTTTRVSGSALFAEAVGFSSYPAISADGRYIAYLTLATNVFTPDANGVVGDVIVRANPVPTITSALPSSAARGASTAITVTGTNFLPGVSAFFGNNITLTNVNRISENQVVLTINVQAGAGTGPRAVLVFNPGTGAGILAGAAASFALTVT